MENCDKLLPAYLRFVRGVVDSEDSAAQRLARDAAGEQVSCRRSVASSPARCFELLSDTAKRGPRAPTRRSVRGVRRVPQRGLHTDNAHKEQLTELAALSQHRARRPKWISLREYVDTMPEGQDAIYYITGDSVEALTQSAPTWKACKLSRLCGPADDRRGRRVGGARPASSYAGQAPAQRDPGRPGRCPSRGSPRTATRTATRATRARRPRARTTRPTGPRSILCWRKAKEVLGERIKEVRASSRLTTERRSCLVDDGRGAVPQHGADPPHAANRDVPEPQRGSSSSTPRTPSLQAANRLRPSRTRARPRSRRGGSSSSMIRPTWPRATVPDPSGDGYFGSRVCSTKWQRVGDRW